MPKLHANHAKTEVEEQLIVAFAKAHDISHDEADAKKPVHKPKKDKMQQVKDDAKMVKEIIKQQKADAKRAHEEEREQVKQWNKTERSRHHSQTKRARKEAREAVKKAEKEQAAVCEHGVPKCSICFEHKDARGKVYHHRDK